MIKAPSEAAVFSPSISPGSRDELAGHVIVWIALLFVGSGGAALIYEVVWFQLLQKVIGSTGVSLGLLLGAYMGGLCLGSCAFSAVVSTRRHPLRVYALLESGIAISGLLVVFLIPYVSQLYVAGASEGGSGVLLRGLISAICLVPPTTLMGATLPAVARWVETTKQGVSWLGYFYGANIAGAVLGCLFAGFYVLRIFDLIVATYIAVAINLAVAIAGFVLATRSRTALWYASSLPAVPSRLPGASSIYIGAALSGTSALGAQVVWTRLLSLMLGTTVYTFAIILAVFLTGLGIGTAVGSSLARRIQRPRLALGACQVLVAATVAWTAFSLTRSLPYWPVDPWLSISPWFNFQIDILRTVWAILPSTLLWGASFPLALAALAREPGLDTGRITGRLYAVNTAGAIAGALAFSLAFIPEFGTLRSQQLLIGISAVAGFVLLLPLVSANAAVRYGESTVGWKGAGFLAAAAAAVSVMIGTVSEVPWQAIAYGRRMAPMIRAADLGGPNRTPTRIQFRGEGMNASLLIAEEANQRTIYINGKAVASNTPDDMRIQRMLGHLPALVHTNPRDVMVVGFGAGVSAGSFVGYPELERIVVAELEPLVPAASSRAFAEENEHVFDHRRTQLVYDDGRHYLLTTDRRFDVITSDPVHPWVKGNSSLFSREYFQLVRSRLKPGGVIAQWVPLYDSDRETTKSILATFFDVFPDGNLWSNNAGGRGFDLVLTAGPPVIDVDAMQQRLEQPSYASVIRSLEQVGFNSAVEVLSTYAGRAKDLQPWLAGAQLNSDRDLRLEYLAGMGLNSMQFPNVYREIVSYRSFPKDLFVGSDERLALLKRILAQTP